VLGNEIADASLRLDSATSTMPSAARWWSNHACCDEIRETIVRCVDGRQSGDGATSIGDDHFFTGLHAIDVLAETILQLADPHLGPGSSYIHDSSVATPAIRSTDRFGSRCAPSLSEPAPSSHRRSTRSRERAVLPRRTLTTRKRRTSRVFPGGLSTCRRIARTRSAHQENHDDRTLRSRPTGWCAEEVRQDAAHTQTSA